MNILLSEPVVSSDWPKMISPPFRQHPWLRRLLLACGTFLATDALAATKLQLTHSLEIGAQVKIVCFGDSVTGVYYHTGARRAWCDLLGVALSRLYPKSHVQMINAGVSGNDTAAALKRMGADVLGLSPQLVVVMFGLNDVVRVPPESFRANLGEIVKRSRDRSAEVILMTPNSIYPDDARRPPSRVAQYAEIVRQVGQQLQVPVADCFRAYEEVRMVSRKGWVRLMSDAIHPNMRGHAVFAEEVAWTLSGRRTSMEEVPPLEPALPRVRSQIQARRPVRVVAMNPYDELIGPALQRAAPGLQVQVTAWDADLKSLADIESQAKEIGWWRFRGNGAEKEKPDLVVVAVPASALAPDDEAFYRSYTWVLNWSLSFGTSGWDCIAILPSVASPELGQGGQAAERLALDVIRGQDIPWLQRSRRDATPSQELLARWLASLLGKPK